MQPITIGVDIAKSVFQVHGVDGDGEVVVRKQLRRAAVEAFFAGLAPCLVGMEACATSHHWARVLGGLGHEVKLMPPSYVKPYVKRGKNDAVDAEAICEAVTRPTMRFVAVKSAEQQSVLMLHRSRELLVRQRTMLSNAVRGHLAEFGIVTALGIDKLEKLVVALLEDGDDRLEEMARDVLAQLAGQMRDLQARIKELERRLEAWHRSSEASRRLATIPGIGVITATALAATVTDASAFGSGRHFAAWLGLVPRQSSTGGKERLGRISKMGDRYLRRLLVVGATAVIRYVKRRATPLAAWADTLLARRPARLVSVALANKLARIVWAVLARGGTYRAIPAAAAG